MEGGKEMNDLLLGVIIGGLIGLVGSAIQGYYSLKGRREENLSRERQQSTQIQHEKDSQLLSRIIERRARYLDPLFDQLDKLLITVHDFQDKLLKAIVPYICKEKEIQVKGADKQEFIQKLKTVESASSAIAASNTEIFETSMKVTDKKLVKLLEDLITEKLYSLMGAYYKMNISLQKSTTGHDFMYDFEALLKSIRDVNVCVAFTNRRIESLLAGADAGDE